MERFALKDAIDMIAATFVRFSERDRPEFERLPELERCRQWRKILRANFVGVRTGPDGHKARGLDHGGWRTVCGNEVEPEQEDPRGGSNHPKCEFRRPTACCWRR